MSIFTRPFAVLLLCPLAVVTACGPARQPTTPAAPPERQPLPAGDQASTRDAWLKAAFQQDRLVDEPAAAASFGPPLSRRVDTRANDFVDGQTDSIISVQYRGGVRVVYYAVTSGPTFPIEFSVTESRHLPPGVDVGSSWEDVLNRFGPPSGELDGSLFYMCACRGEPIAEDQAQFVVQGGRVSRIRIVYYWD